MFIKLRRDEVQEDLINQSKKIFHGKSIRCILKRPLNQRHVTVIVIVFVALGYP